jgi:hypothetical protein
MTGRDVTLRLCLSFSKVDAGSTTMVPINIIGMLFVRGACPCVSNRVIGAIRLEGNCSAISPA